MEAMQKMVDERDSNMTSIVMQAITPSELYPATIGSSDGMHNSEMQNANEYRDQILANHENGPSGLS